MLSAASKSKTTLYIASSSASQQDNNNAQQFHSNQRKIVKSGSHYNLMPFNKSPTSLRQERSTGDDSKIESDLHRSDSFSSVKFLNEGEKLVSSLCDTSHEMPEDKGVNQYSNITVLSRDKTPIKDNTNQSDNKHDESVSSQIVQLAVEACTIAENIAIANKNRPCFKNIQTICEKTKSNVQKPDAAVANLHSQGVPWVIKNFIFSFVRILDGWKGVKELLSEKHESFKRIETQYYSPQIRECFFEWQISTKNMLDSIYKTFSALDSGFQAEQQRYKRYSGINLIAIQNKDQKQKQQIKRGSPGPVASPSTSQPQFSQFYNQWQNNNIHPLSQSVSHGNIYSQWSVQPNPKVMPFHNPNPTVHKSDNVDFPKSAIPGTIKILQNKEDIKIAPNVILQQNMGNVTNQTNEDMAIKQFSINSLTSDNITHKNTEAKKANTNADTTPFVSTSWSFNNEVFNPYPNYWVNQQSISENKIFGNIHSDTTFGGGLNVKCNPNPISTNPSSFPSLPNISSPVDSYSEGPDIATVYMNPGSYNLPISKNKLHVHSSGADFATMESMTVHNSSVPKDTMTPYSKTIMSAFSPALSDNQCNILKKNPNERTNIYLNTSALPMNKSVLKEQDESMFTYTDKEWETAIQLAPKFITSIHQSPDDTRTDQCPRFYSTLEANKNNEEILESNCIESVSWNKISQQFFGGCSQPEFDFNYLTNSDPSASNIHFKTDNLKPDVFINTELNSPSLSNDTKSESVDSFEACKMDTEFGSADNVKKVKKKNNQNYGKYSGRKRNDYIASWIKKMENILVTLWNMDRNWPLDKEPKLSEVVKNVITFPIVSDRLKGSHYSDVHQVAGDIRMIFFNAYEYLKVNPDEKLQQQVDEMQECFEKMFSEEILSKEQKGKSKKRNDFYNN